MGVEFKSITCPKCGANLDFSQYADKAVCRYCGTIVLVERKTPIVPKIMKYDGKYVAIQHGSKVLLGKFRIVQDGVMLEGPLTRTGGLSSYWGSEYLEKLEYREKVEEVEVLEINVQNIGAIRDITGEIYDACIYQCFRAEYELRHAKKWGYDPLDAYKMFSGYNPYEELKKFSQIKSHLEQIISKEEKNKLWNKIMKAVEENREWQFDRLSPDEIEVLREMYQREIRKNEEEKERSLHEENKNNQH